MNKKWIFGIGMAVAMLGMGSMAQASGYYCVPYAFSNDTPTVSTIIHVSKKNACSIGCQNEWHDYISGNYDNYYKMAIDFEGPFESKSDAKYAFNKQKRRARQDWHQPFHHATDFSCSGD